MCAHKGQDYVTQITTSDISDVRVLVNGNAVPFSTADLTNNNYTITIAASHVVCPGPLVISGLTGGDITVSVYC